MRGGYGGGPRGGGFRGGGRYGGFHGGRPWRGGGFYRRPGYYRSGCLGCATYIFIILAVIVLALIFLI